VPVMGQRHGLIHFVAGCQKLAGHRVRRERTVWCFWHQSARLWRQSLRHLFNSLRAVLHGLKGRLLQEPAQVHSLSHHMGGAVLNLLLEMLKLRLNPE
jgi:hypothetical protein